MTDKQQPPLPTLQPGDSHMESLIEAAVQGHADTRDAMRWLVRQLVPAKQPAESEPVRVCVKVQGGEAHCTTGQWMSEEVGYLVVVPKEWQSNHPAPGVPDETINKICYLATEIRFANSDDAAQAVIDRIRAILALRPVQVPMTDEVRERALDLLATLFDAYENGPACYESPDDCSGYLGNAVQIDHDTFHVIASLLNVHRPITAQAKKDGA